MTELVDRITIKNNGEEVELFMSYSMLSHVSRMFNSMEELPAIATNQSVADQFIATILAGKDNKYDPSTVDIDELGETISPSDMGLIIEWGSQHVIDFFLTRAERLKKTMDQNGDRIKEFQKG
jgi:hypothetical protein